MDFSRIKATFSSGNAMPAMPLVMVIPYNLASTGQQPLLVKPDSKEILR